MTKSILTFALALSTSATAFAFDLASGLTPPSRQRPVINYSGTFHERSTFPSNENGSTYFQALDVTVPVYKTEDSSFSVSVSANELVARPTIGEYSNFYKIEGGLSYTKMIDEKRMWSVLGNYGTASDKPFANDSVNTLGITGLYSVPNDETSSWLWLVNYSNNRPILNNIPLPGFAYFYYPSKDFRMVLGAPFASVNWQFSEKWGVDAFTLVPWVIRSSLNYSFGPFSKAYLGLDFSQITYYAADRTERKDRLFFDEKKLFVGIKSPLSKEIFADFQIGHAFDRAFFQAENYEIDPENPTTLGNAYYAKLSLRIML